MPPSHTVHLRLNSGALLDSHSPPLSFVNTMIVLLDSFSLSTARRMSPTPRPMPSTIATYSARVLVDVSLGETSLALSGATEGCPGTWYGQWGALYATS